MDYFDRYTFDPAGLNSGGVAVHVFDQEGGSISKEKSRLAIPGGLVYVGNLVVDDVIVAVSSGGGDDVNSSSCGSGGSSSSSGGSSSSSSCSSSSSSGGSSGSSSCGRVSESIISDDLFDSLLKRVYTPNDMKTPNINVMKTNVTKTNNKRNQKNQTKKVTSK